MPEKQEEVLQLFSEGASMDEVAVCLGVTRQTLHNWVNDAGKAEFARLMQIGVQLSKAWWDRQAREGLTQRGFNGHLWEVNMRNRFGWLGYGDSQREGVMNRDGERGEVESVRETVDVAAIIQKAQEKTGVGAKRLKGPRDRKYPLLPDPD